MKKDPMLYVIHILECIKRVEDYTKKGKEHFSSDRMVYDAVLRNLQTMSEATKN